jgi:hypothetical protein
MPLKCLYYRQKMTQRYFTLIKVGLFSLDGGKLKILTESLLKNHNFFLAEI